MRGSPSPSGHKAAQHTQGTCDTKMKSLHTVILTIMTKVKYYISKMELCRNTWTLTFGRGLWAVRGDLSHAGAVAAERHQTRDDCRLAEADVAHDCHATVGTGIGAVEVGVDLLEEPLAAREDRVHGDAGHLKQQRFEGDVLRPIRCKTHWRVEENKNWLVV